VAWHERHLHRTQVQVRKINKKQLAIRNWRGMMDIIQAGYNHHTFMSLRGAFAATKQSLNLPGDCFATLAMTSEIAN